jgi:hypothetical protein
LSYSIRGDEMAKSKAESDLVKEAASEVAEYIPLAFQHIDAQLRALGPGSYVVNSPELVAAFVQAMAIRITAKEGRP